MKRAPLVLSLPLVCASVIALYACSSSSSSGTTSGVDSGVHTQPASSDAGNTKCGDAGYACGQPCDPGNSLGVGKFCDTENDCSGLKASLCAAIENGNDPVDQQEHFCTFPCTAVDAGGAADECGSNATCECATGGCGCTPNYCL